MSSHRYWADYLKSARNGYDRPVANNTRVRWTGFGEGKTESAIAIELHSTDVVTFHPDGRIVLASGGWRTLTTGQRIAQFSPARIHSERGEWYLPFENDPNDPQPPGPFEREIPKPYAAVDPGPEPPEVREYTVGEGDAWRERVARWDWESRKRIADNAAIFLERFGSMEAWQEAYITEFRAVRENRRTLKAWSERNNEPFRDGIEVNCDGEVPLKFKREHLKALKRSERERAIHNRRVREHEKLVRKRMAENEERKRVQRLMTEALAESIAVDLELQRPRWNEVKAKHGQEVS